MQLELRSYVCEPSEASISSAAAPWGTVLSQNKKCKMDASEEKKEGMTSPSPLPLADDSEMRGVHAIRDLPQNTVCMTIPRRCLITVEMGQATEIGQAILQSDLDLDAPKHIYLMIYLLWDRKVNGKHSFFDPYYQILPPTLQNMPIFWNDAELKELTGSFLLQQIRDRNQAIIEDYNAICAVAPQMKAIATLREFQWARMCVCSRNFGLCIEGHRTSALVPHADMLNHYRPRETKWTYDETIEAFTITTLQYIAAGSEVLDSYGQKCNHRFLLNYGFAIEDNREMDGFCPNEVPIELKLSPDDPILKEKLDFWVRGGQEAHPSTSSQDISQFAALTREQISAVSMKRIRVCVTNNENTRLLLGLLRILVSTPDEFRTVLSGGASAPASSILSVAAGGLTPATAVSNPRTRATPPWMEDATRQRSSTRSDAVALLNHNNFNVTPPFRLDADTASSNISANSYHRSYRDMRHPINLRNEREAMRYLRDVIHELLSRYPTALQHDIDALSNVSEYPKFSNRRHAKIQVKGEKEVLHHYLKWAQTAIDVINVIESELREEVEQYHNLAAGKSYPGIEVHWHGDDPRRVAPTMVNETTHDRRPQPTSPSSFEWILRRMEDEMNDDMEHSLDVHCTILRYCADVLGNMRREELRMLRRHFPAKSTSQRSSLNHDLGSRNGEEYK
jgi:SET domain/Rubisco LSMT substrate-binding